MGDEREQEYRHERRLRLGLTRPMLADQPRSRTNDPGTSHEAAVKVRKKIGNQHLAVLLAVEQWPGMTAWELARKMAGSSEFTHQFAHTAQPDERYYQDWTRRRLPELTVEFIDRGEPRVCTVTGNRALTWWRKVKP